MQVGDVIAKRYRVAGEIGAGGMAVVYRVTDLELEEDVALKLFGRSPEDETSVARFKQEMRIARRLSHPHIVRTYEFGAWRRAYFLTMELLEGKDLDQMIEDAGGKLPVGQAMRLFAQAFDGLGAAHKLGVIHRDVKPANMFVVDGGKTLKVMDFGIAKLADATSGHTATGAVVGTPAFISPERLRGIDDGGPAGDLYAMGVLMYQALTGVLPFGGTDVAQLFLQILEKTPMAPSRLDPDLSSKIDQIVMRLIAKNPGERYASCAEARKAMIAAWEDMKRLSIDL
ncbi:MAG: serine/threonine protein kinase [Proteobacteria bacterium]|nr:serine/threonine protein kinase [Pseudomonadota bacterium]